MKRKIVVSWLYFHWIVLTIQRAKKLYLKYPLLITVKINYTNNFALKFQLPWCSTKIVYENLGPGRLEIAFSFYTKEGNNFEAEVKWEDWDRMHEVSKTLLLYSIIFLYISFAVFKGSDILAFWFDITTVTDLLYQFTTFQTMLYDRMETPILCKMFLVCTNKQQNWYSVMFKEILIKQYLLTNKIQINQKSFCIVIWKTTITLHSIQVMSRFGEIHLI